ncbi:KAP family P-loop NTPase fold protein [Rhodospirillum centenum]|nr:P-loop NTPase fold protein [Rhodospirillum centenum]
MQVDRPIRTGDEDLFDRRSFAERIADVIASRSDPSSLVIGVYGPWGDGKTSTLNMIRARLSSRSDIVQINYNPWQFSADRDRIAHSFWNMLVAALQEILVDIDKAGEAVSTLASFVPVYGETLSKAVDKHLTRDLEQVRRGVSDKLEVSDRRIVVFIDDIDRLERAEVQALFRLVKLSGDFPKVTYVLAFDDKMVAASIGEAYGNGDVASGRRFLEKIVQVPLHLPPADRNALREMMFKTCGRVLEDAGIVLPSEEGGRIATAITMALMSFVKTPRMAKLFDNALTFAIPVLKGEVHVGDQILIEAVRVFIPNLYEFIRDNQDIFLSESNDRNKEGRKNRLQKAMEELNLPERDIEQLSRHLLEVLFPQLSGWGHGSQWQVRRAREQRVCSPDHFRRYFTYAVPRGDIADAMIDGIIDDAAQGGAIQDSLLTAIRNGATAIFIRKLRHREEVLAIEAVPSLVRAVTAASTEIRIILTTFMGDFEFRQAAILVSQLLARLPPDDQDALLIEIAEGPCLLFPVYVLERSLPDGGEGGWLTHDRQVPALAILHKRTISAAREGRLEEATKDWMGVVFGHLRRNLDPDALNTFRLELSEWVAADSSAPVALLRAYAPFSDRGPGDFEEDNYRVLTSIVDGNLFLSELKKALGDEIDVTEYVRKWDAAGIVVDRRLAMQFSYWHHRANILASGDD